MHSISTSFAAGQVNEANLTVQASLMLQLHLHDGVGAGTLRVRTRGATSSQAHTNL